MWHRRTSALTAVLAGAMLSTIAVAAPVTAAPGDPVADFGDDGVVELEGTSSTRRVLAVQTDGRVLTLQVDSGRQHLVRLLPNGRLDTTFSRDGKVVLGPEGTAVEVSGIALDGRRIVVAMREKSPDESHSIVVGRLTGIGTWDRSFGDGGRVSIDDPDEVGYVGGVTVDAESRVVVVANHTGVASVPYVHRITSDGTPDRDFSRDGTARVPTARGSTTLATSVDTAPDGGIVVGGVDISPSATRTIVSRLTAGGKPVNSFGAGGHVALNDGAAAYTETHEVEFDRAGRVVGSGNSSPDGRRRLRLFAFRLDRTGALDETFAGDGWRTIDVDGENVFGGSLAQRSDGSLIVLGSIGRTDELVVVALTDRGRTDRSFGDGGTASVSFTPETVGGTAIEVSPDGRRIYATANAGVSAPGTARVVALRGR